MILKKLAVKLGPAGIVSSNGSVSPDPEVLQAWEDKLNSPELEDWSVADLMSHEGFVWCVMQKEVL